MMHDQAGPLVDDLAEGLFQGAQHERDGGDLGRRAHEGGDGGGGALVDVRRPHVERHGRQLEGEAGDDENDADDEAGRRGLRRGQHAGQLGELHRAGEAVGERDAVEQQARGERAQDEVFQPGFGGAELIAGEGAHDVDRQRLQLEPEIQRHQVGGAAHDHHADGAEQDQDRELEPGDAFADVVVQREDGAHARAGEDEQLHEAGEAVDGEQVAVGHAVGRGEDEGGGQHEGAEAEHGAEEVAVLLATARRG